MFNRKNMHIAEYVLIGIIIFFIFEAIFIHTESLVWIGIWLVIIFLARQHYYRPIGRMFFWIGLVALGITVINTITFQFVLFITLVLFLLYWYQKKERTNDYQPQFPINQQLNEEKVLFTNQWFGKQQTEQSAYEWNDINIQTIVGETNIDLTYTVLPKGEPLIIVRHLFGTMKIVVPFDVEVSIHHSVLFGSVDILNHRDDTITNRVIHLQTEAYNQANQKVKIVTSMIAGKIEVTRE
ncbi:cell wall-active antibiotics response protein LiaF [Paraliobacillus salinarum]|uniref:cell wall-active antibiotics response protein LiaF n=1 Tax=Paraliobacillus salinarum TaxID=1158996 RepID=UPI0015F75326|nr:cell wall-active antibiotics response protein LiaF [Paraliobacillus salinarum]